jgi:hypothetical protein
MIQVDYPRFGWLKSKQIFFGDCLPPTSGYHFISCKNYYRDLPYHPPYKRDECITILIDLTEDLDTIFKQIHTKRRNIIRQGLKFAYSIIHQKPTINNLKEFQELYNKYTVRKGAQGSFSLSTLTSLLPHMTFFIGKYDNIVAEIMILVHDDRTVRCHKVTRNEDHPRYKDCYQLGSVLQWEVLRHFKGLGYQVFDFGGAITEDPTSPMSGVSRYKMSFGGEKAATYWYEAAITPLGRALDKGKHLLWQCLRRNKA